MRRVAAAMATAIGRRTAAHTRTSPGSSPTISGTPSSATRAGQRPEPATHPRAAPGS